MVETWPRLRRTGSPGCFPSSQEAHGQHGSCYVRGKAVPTSQELTAVIFSTLGRPPISRWEVGWWGWVSVWNR